MENRLKQLPLPVQKRVYEIAGEFHRDEAGNVEGGAGTICSDFSSIEYNQAMSAFIYATNEELQDFLFDHAKYNLEHRISWHYTIQEFSGNRRKQIYNEYLRSPEWWRKRQAVMQHALRPLPPEPPIIIKRSLDRYGRLIESIEVEWKSICEHENCSNEAKEVHHYNYDRVGKELIGRKPTESEENDLIAVCRECHKSLDALRKANNCV